MSSFCSCTEITSFCITHACFYTWICTCTSTCTCILQGESSSLCWLTKGKQFFWGIPSWTQLYCQIYKNIRYFYISDNIVVFKTVYPRKIAYLCCTCTCFYRCICSYLIYTRTCTCTCTCTCVSLLLNKLINIETCNRIKIDHIFVIVLKLDTFYRK